MRKITEHDESLFYCDVEENDVTCTFIDKLRDFSITNSKQIYIVKRALGSKKDDPYELDEVAIVLMPKHPILLLDYSKTNGETQLKEFFADFKEDLVCLANKYGYDKVLGRGRKWPDDLFVTAEINKFDINSYLYNEIDGQYFRKIDLLISLLIGSINSIDKVGINDPETLLDKVKQKIILFDGQQSRFIYQNLDQKTITIQGMAGTGKTELLLHKLKDVYSSEKESVVVFTCHNKVLANDMRKRIPQFFNFMKVDEQIDWDSRLFVFSSWGSEHDSTSGLYSYICNKYHIPFSTFSNNHNFDIVCKNALNELAELEDFEPCFDYIFIDESQDFKEGFFDLCRKVTRKTVYIAGDIFQNIYDTTDNMDVKPDFLLNKCYRTDPKTLMFAHAVGMGLYETPQLNWMDDTAWSFCGYSLVKNKEKGTVSLSRKPLRRFEDIDATNTIRLSMCSEDEYSSQVLKAIDEIKKENPNVLPEDISVIILGSYSSLCSIADKIVASLFSEFKWKAAKGYETKVKASDKVYISNVNNIKGLEFPFVICVIPRGITNNILLRNSIYMALTRSFLTSYFIVDDENLDFYNTYSEAIDKITTSGEMEVHEPTLEERKDMRTKIHITLLEKKKTFEQIMFDFFEEEYPNMKKDLRKLIEDTMRRFAIKDTESDIKQRARKFIEEVIGVDNI
ncbi:MAG: DEAD/DEAH box helicase [Clostridia bacterium]|nr:DEAD/DEAH box helicase [Clostridia bacterium]